MVHPIDRRRFLQSLLALAAAAPLGACAAGRTDAGSAGAGAIPQPRAWLRTRWGADPFAFGSYSYLRAGSTAADRRALAAPLGTALFFAGEATSVDHAATVHGAYLSGRRAAREVAAVARPDATVVVVGAGMAGLSAAQALGRQPRRAVVVEGRDRIGGRIWTDRSLGGIPLDRGASWVHGTEANPVMPLARGAESVLAPTDFDNEIVYDRAGRLIAAGRLERVDELLDQLLEDAQRSSDFPSGTSLAAALDSSPAAAGREPVRPGDLDFALTRTIELDYAADATEIDRRYADGEAGFDGDDALLAGGYGEIADQLASGLDVRLSQRVLEVRHGPEGATVRTEAGDIQADHAIVTLPLGVLQQRTVAFDPPLPDDKVAAIVGLGMGVLDKVFLWFPKVFWDPEADVIGYVSEPSGRWAQWLNMFRLTGDPVLVAFNAGRFARELEDRPDDAVLADAMSVLRTIYGRSAG